jgi:hypothetical protein
MNSSKLEPQKKAYSPPKINDLSAEDIKLFLLDHAIRGNQDAKDLLNSLTPTSA